MPFNIWCGGCNAHIAKGVRFNAQKKQAGTYHSSKIWSFRMKCHLCDNWFEIQTDPQHHDFIVVDGAQKKTELGNDYEDKGTFQLMSAETKEKIDEDPFARLEHLQKDTVVAETKEPELYELAEYRDNIGKDDYQLNSLLRSKFRVEKKLTVEDEKKAKSKGIFVPLLPEAEEDKEAANRVKYGQQITPVQQYKLSKQLTNGKSIFAKDKSGSTLQQDLKQRLALEKSIKRGLDVSLFKKSTPTTSGFGINVNTPSSNVTKVKPKVTVVPKVKQEQNSAS